MTPPIKAPRTAEGQTLLEAFFTEGAFPVDPEAVIAEIEAEAVTAFLEDPATRKRLITSLRQHGLMYPFHEVADAILRALREGREPR